MIMPSFIDIFAIKPIFLPFRMDLEHIKLPQKVKLANIFLKYCKIKHFNLFYYNTTL